MGCCISRTSDEEGMVGPYRAGGRRSSRIGSSSSRAINARRSRSMGGGTRSGSEAPETAAGTPAGSQLRGIGGAGVASDDRHPLASHPPSGISSSSNYQQREQERQRRRASRRQSSQQQQQQSRGGGDQEHNNDDNNNNRDRRSRHSRNLSQHINKPLKRHEWISENRQWTRSALDRERTEFFDTRVTGRQEIWQTIHAALEILWHQAQKDAAIAASIAQQNGDGTLAAPSDYEGEDRHTQHSDDEEEENDRSIALATAQTILGAAEITLPTGDLAQGGAYDSLGNYYQLPEYIVSDPMNIATSSPASESGFDEDHDENEHGGYADADTKGTMSVVADEEVTAEGGEGALESGDEVPSHSREQKGKAVVTSVVKKDPVVVRARLSDGSKDVNVRIDKTDSVRVLGRKVAEKAKLSSDKQVRIAFMGKILKDSSSLIDQGWQQGNIVNALVFNR
ncbi:hypothetical protein B0T20DRAFT_179214 [Sordaria brevicollis]|uniref:Ubiquitin-like domain-containing protein n=1 Tax=Sordaria brevicollis TaxID=83679 RepID=A0AAE0UDH9_SORBR|nr:hypothetical protein B0T20DRAFT_179214 [Sordaria brevicollis]